MSRRLYVLSTPKQRAFVADVVKTLLKGWRVEIKPPVRTLPQNDLMWAALTDVSEQHDHNGVHLEPEDWKLVFLDYFWRLKNAELRLVPSIDGKGFVPLSGRSSSDLSKDEMSELIDLIHATGADWGVVFHDGAARGAAEEASGPNSAARAA
jgi:hypothetical protein